MAALLDKRAVGAAIGYTHRLSTSWMAGASASAAYVFPARTLDARAMLALEARF